MLIKHTCIQARSKTTKKNIHQILLSETCIHVDLLDFSLYSLNSYRYGVYLKFCHIVPVIQMDASFSQYWGQRHLSMPVKYILANSVLNTSTYTLYVGAVFYLTICQWTFGLFSVYNLIHTSFEACRNQTVDS